MLLGGLSDIHAWLVGTQSQAMVLQMDRFADPEREEPSGCVLEKKPYFIKGFLTCDPDFIAEPCAIREVLLSDLQERLCSLLLAHSPNTESPGIPGRVDFSRQDPRGCGTCRLLFSLSDVPGSLQAHGL